MDSSYVLELKGIEKHFGGVTALSGVSFQLEKGEVHAIMGENGAGKSTLIKAITGVHSPDAGSIIYQGEEVHFKSSLEAAAAGVSAVYQHATAFPTLSVAENVFMGQEIKNKLGLYNWKEMRKKAKELLAPLNDKIDVNANMSSLSVAEQQMVEIAKALSRQLRVLILDEPTASLTQKECEELYDIVDHLKERGVSVVLITHRMEDMYIHSAKEAFEKGIGLLPEDRQIEGLVYELPIYQNVTSADLKRYSFRAIRSVRTRSLSLNLHGSTVRRARTSWQRSRRFRAASRRWRR